MFIEEEEWNDEPAAQSLSQTVFINSQKTNSSSNVKSKGVGKKSLLRTLQALGSVPDWKSEAPRWGTDSDSEGDAEPAQAKKKKRKKVRKRGRKAAETAENGETEECVKEEKSASPQKKKDNKTGPPKVKISKPSDDVITKSASVEAEKEAGDTETLNRKQWKNKMKNKRKCNNKYRLNKPEEDKPAATETQEVISQLPSNKEEKTTKTTGPSVGLKKEKEVKRQPPKRKKTEEDDEEKQPIVKEKQIKNQSLPGPGPTADPRPAEPEPAKKLSRAQTLKREKLRKLLTFKGTERKERSEEALQEEEEEEARDEPAVLDASADRSASLRSRMEHRLEAARFRYINELLYTTSSGEARRMFKQDPQAYQIYHKGYTAQVQRWPANPVDAIIAYIQQKPPSLVVADFGCGDCKIARSVKNKVHNFDLAATCDLVTVCDMANVPLADRTVDIAVFCLSLMGTNLGDFLAEANRVLKISGVLKIAEVASRFDNVRNFLAALANLGFKLVSKDTENSHFYLFDFVKTGDAPDNVKKFGLQLKACLYKKR
ncbi:uncharacterized protein rrp8 [Genypterus blacodes]|uniref:uncharacterized protein rrp8 n=1 Tax=Genypterus blacodes TaxID=154954 RepID=UPI003F7680FB